MWYQQAELVHGRWAMLGVTGMAAPELIHNPLVQGPMPNWFEAPLWDGYAASPNALFVVQMLLMNWAEVLRWQDMKNPGSVHADPYDNNRKCTGTDVGYPGGEERAQPKMEKKLPKEKEKKPIFTHARHTRRVLFTRL